MPNWKKVIISGSDASLNTLDLTGDLTLDDGSGASPSLYFKNQADNFWRYLMETGGDLSIKEGTSTRLTYQTGGNVGIGQTSPTAKLNVKGSGSTSATDALLVENSSGTDLLTVRDDGRVTLLQTGLLYFGSAQALAFNAGNELRYGYDAAVQKHTFYTNSGTAQLHITNDDKVGIGTTSPDNKLQVNGTIRAIRQ